MSFKFILKSAAARVLYRAGLTAPGRRGRGRLSIVTFHRVLPENERRAYPFPGLVTTPEELDAFLGYLTEHFDCGTLEAQHRRFENCDIAARPLLAVTFDDAQHDNYRCARPVLRRHGLKASFFAPVDAVQSRMPLWHDRLGFGVMALSRQGGRSRLRGALEGAGLSFEQTGESVGNIISATKKLDLAARLRLVDALVVAAGAAGDVPDFARLMTFDELAELAADGHEIGSHSMTHCMMPECDDAVLSYELSESRRVLQDRIGQPIDSFCYPNGNSDDRTAAGVAKAGYRRAVTTAWGSNGSGANRFRLRRCDMDARRVTGTDGKLLPAMVAFRMSGFYPGLN